MSSQTLLLFTTIMNLVNNGGAGAHARFVFQFDNTEELKSAVTECIDSEFKFLVVGHRLTLICKGWDL